MREKMQSAERLSLMIRFNHRGSLTSLDRGSRLELFRTNSSRRNSACVELSRSHGKANSSPKIDLLKSTLEVHNVSNPQLNIKAPPPPPLQRHTTKVCLLYIWIYWCSLCSVISLIITFWKIICNSLFLNLL